MPSGMNARVGTSGSWSISAWATGEVSTAPKPKPPTARPVMSPRLSGNHLRSIAIGTM